MGRTVVGCKEPKEVILGLLLRLGLGLGLSLPTSGSFLLKIKGDELPNELTAGKELGQPHRVATFADGQTNCVSRTEGPGIAVFVNRQLG